MIQEKQISPDVKARWGYPDGHMEVCVATGIPLVGEVTLKLDADSLFRVGDVLNQAFDHLKALGQLQPRAKNNGQQPQREGRYARRG